MNESHILTIFAGALAIILSGAVAAIVKIFNMTEKSRVRDKQIDQRRWEIYMESFKEQIATNLKTASALEAVNQVLQTHFRGDEDG